MYFTHERQELQCNLRRSIDSDVNPYVDEWEAAEMFPAKQPFKKMDKLGFLGIARPTEFGGPGLDYSYAMAMAETLGHIHCGGVSMVTGVQTDMTTPALARFGSDEPRAQFPTPAISGDAVACVGVSEPDAGSDVASIKTTARKDGDDHIINGSKMWITNSLRADWMCLLANMPSDPAHRNKSLIIAPMNTKGVSAGKKIRKIGMNSPDTGFIYFDGVRVSQRYRIGEEGRGFTYQMLQPQEECLWVVVSNLATMTMCVETTAEYARECKFFGVSLLDSQWVHFKLAELKTEVEALRVLAYHACDLYIRGQDVTELVSVAKLKAGCLACTAPDACLQFWGGMGFAWDNPISHYYRGGRLGSIDGGVGEVMLGIICKYVNTLPGKKD